VKNEDHDDESHFQVAELFRQRWYRQVALLGQNSFALVDVLLFFQLQLRLLRLSFDGLLKFLDLLVFVNKLQLELAELKCMGLIVLVLLNLGFVHRTCQILATRLELRLPSF
jgi:hypothetical protein